MTTTIVLNREDIIAVCRQWLSDQNLTPTEGTTMKFFNSIGEQVEELHLVVECKQ